MAQNGSLYKKPFSCTTFYLMYDLTFKVSPYQRPYILGVKRKYCLCVYSTYWKLGLNQFRSQVFYDSILDYRVLGPGMYIILYNMKGAISSLVIAVWYNVFLKLTSSTESLMKYPHGPIISKNTQNQRTLLYFSWIAL